MQESDVLFLGLLIVSGFNARRFEDERRRDEMAISDLIVAKKNIEGSSLEADPKFKDLVQRVIDFETVIAFKGNWLPSKYRQFILASLLGLSTKFVFDSSIAAIFAFLTFCCFFSTAALRFWIGIFARKK